MFRNSRNSYGVVSKCLHWLIAVCMLGLVWLGWWMVGLGYFDAWYNRSLSIHRSLGIVILGLAVIFGLWKVVSPSPRLQQELQTWERWSARSMHALLFCTMFVLPLSGYMISTSAGTGFSLFGIAELPAILPISEEVRNLAIEVHFYVAYALAVLVAVHVGAALKHQFLDKHGALRRMLW